MVDHDLKPGPIERCQICGSDDLHLIIDLGHQPPCDSLLTAEQLASEPETHYPLRLNRCGNCSLAQLDYLVPAREVYPFDYPYRAGLSWPVVNAHRQMASKLVSHFGQGFAVDIGSNDGTLLKEMAALGCEVMGVEPTNIADIARAAGVRTVKDFFSEQMAAGLVSNSGKAHIITMTNVFAHMGDLGEVMRGICALLAEDGVLVIENHYLLDILEGNQFDSIYHEHVRTYSLFALRVLFAQYGLEVFDAERVPRYGGNIRVFVGWKGKRTVGWSVGSLAKQEGDAALRDHATWDRFAVRILNGRDRFMDFTQGRTLAGCSAPGRASTLLNFYGLREEHMRWTGELPGSLKIGKFLPGCHIPVVSNRRILEEQPEFLVLLAWHYADEIEARLRKEGVRSKLLVPLPELSVRLPEAKAAA